jgi:aryl-alcohol dehydrogenase-like predicted oxidoreductase
MKYNRLGTSGLFVSELSFGTMTFGESYPALRGLTQQDASAGGEGYRGRSEFVRHGGRVRPR